MKSGWLKLVLINLGITLGILFGLNFLINLFEFIIPAINAAVSSEAVKEDERATLRNYADNPELAATHYQEFGNLEAEYRSFIEWSRTPYEGETITINAAGNRVHSDDPSLTETQAEVYFFGGSTIWGTGVLDDQTIPAYFQAISQRPSANKGETAFVSRQSLNQFINLLATESNINTVVFYEGVNDVQYHCRSDIGLINHARTALFHEAIAAESADSTDEARSAGQAFLAYLDTLFLREIRQLAIDIGDALSPERETERIDETLLCDDSPELAEQVARNLLLNWEIAYQTAQANGINMIAVLQPVAYLDDSPVDHLELDEELGRQYEAVYPIVQQLIEEGNYPWIRDYADIFPDDEYVYVDFCHLSENGNRFVAERLVEDL